MRSIHSLKQLPTLPLQDAVRARQPQAGTEVPASAQEASQATPTVRVVLHGVKWDESDAMLQSVGGRGVGKTSEQSERGTQEGD
eukprot:6569713-Alexandrium_andersonii.AAC.1